MPAPGTVAFLLPLRFSRFASKDKATSPFVLFHRWAAGHFGPTPEGHVIAVTATSLHPQDYARLEKVVKTWIRRVHECDLPGRLESTYRWHDLQVGPVLLSQTRIDAENLVPGMAYIKSAKIFEKKPKLSEADL